ncbi:MAG: hypothetical protein KBF76_07160 [Verrucomicrobiales bacterium]|nr:hypothetical protein [Verrucomicrobiales bacterium]
MRFLAELVNTYGPPPASALGSKPESPLELALRTEEAGRLTFLLLSRQSFSFVRVGDLDLALILASQFNTPDSDLFGFNSHSSGTEATGCPGITSRWAERLKSAVENADYVDFNERLWPMRNLLSEIEFNRNPDLFRNPDELRSYILLTWVETEFHNFCKTSRIGFCGAEASILQRLCGKKEFKEAASNFWPVGFQPFFHQPRENGGNLDSNLELLKEDLRNFIRSEEIDTLFLSLGGAAKILCCELAKEENIRCIDFGGMLRALCYLGSDGNRLGRSTHSPFYYRLPFDTVMDAIERAFPEITPLELLAKAHAQVILELQRKTVGWTSTSSEFEFSDINLEFFSSAIKAYQRRYGYLFNMNPKCRIERKRFLLFCGKYHLTLRGKFTHLLFGAKATTASFLNRCGLRKLG